MDLTQGSGNMETLTIPNDSMAAGPRWVLLKRHSDNDSDSTADAKTTAASCTSSGLPFTVSFSVSAPPAASSIHGRWVRGAGSGTSSRDHDNKYSNAHNGDGEGYSESKDSEPEDPELEIIAAHDDAVLIEIRVPACDSYSEHTFEYFLYEAGVGRTPSLSLLPSCYICMQYRQAKGASDVPTATSRQRLLGSGTNDTGILHYDDGELVVAQLEVEYHAPYRTAELCVFRPAVQDWVLRRVPIVHHEGEGVWVRDWTDTDAAVPVGSRFMCWVDYLSGILLWEMSVEEENTKLEYVPLPPETRSHKYDHRDRPQMQYCRNLAATGPDTVRLVSIAPRCCCGGPGKTSCEHSSFAFNITTWTLAVRTKGPMAWVKDGVLDCDELWQLPNYGLLPRVALQYPIVSFDDPDIIWFTVDGADDTVWMVEINTRSKALLSVVRSDKEYYRARYLLPLKLRW